MLDARFEWRFIERVAAFHHLHSLWLIARSPSAFTFPQSWYRVLKYFLHESKLDLIAHSNPPRPWHNRMTDIQSISAWKLRSRSGILFFYIVFNGATSQLRTFADSSFSISGDSHLGPRVINAGERMYVYVIKGSAI